MTERSFTWFWLIWNILLVLLSCVLVGVDIAEDKQFNLFIDLVCIAFGCYFGTKRYLDLVEGK